MKSRTFSKNRKSGRHSMSPRLESNRTYDGNFRVHRTPKKVRLFPEWLMSKPDFRALVEMPDDSSIQYAVSK